MTVTTDPRSASAPDADRPSGVDGATVVTPVGPSLTKKPTGATPADGDTADAPGARSEAAATTAAPAVGSDAPGTGVASGTTGPAAASTGTDPDSLFTSPAETRSSGPAGPGDGGFGSGAAAPGAPVSGSGPAASATAAATATASGATASGTVGGPTSPAGAGTPGAAVPPPGADKTTDKADGPPPSRPAEATTVLDTGTPAGTDGSAPADSAPAADGEMPEEHPEPAVAAVVAGLQDEVLVIDEQPRYHVPGCRSLVAAALIPLPAREAVELGFTPCGWCTPDRTLAARHSANVR